MSTTSTEKIGSSSSNLSSERQNAEAGPSTPAGWHSMSMRVPFVNEEHARLAKRALEVDREQNAEFVDRRLDVEGDELVINYAATTVRLLRLSTNSFLSSLDLVIRTMAEFAPDPSTPRISDEELERIRAESNQGESSGIELRGDGTGAGSGQEVK